MSLPLPNIQVGFGTSVIFFADVVYFIIVEAVLSPSILFRHEKSVCHTRAGWVGLFLFMFKLGLFVWPVANGWWLFVLR
jgi:hypothetical protein